MDCPVELASASVSQRTEPMIEKYEVALLMLLGFAGFSVMLGLAYNALRHYVFRDFHNLDVVFDAGGRVSLSLTTVTATSQLLWPADFLQSPTIASKVGFGGSLWYTMAIVLSILTFAVLCMQLKIRAPGAKTYAQIAYARFGKPAHIMFCTVALFTNLVIVANLILAGKAVIQVLAKDTSNEFICLVLAVLFGSYCLIGGLGTTFYISYFNTALIFTTTSIFILKTSFLSTPDVQNLTSVDSLYASMTCLKGPDGNFADSLLTFRSQSGLINGVIILFMTIAIMFCDQANWQSKIAARPSEGVVGFLLAGFLVFALPASVSYKATLIYKTMSLRHGSNLLTDEEIDSGFITPFVFQALLGKEGSYLLLTLITMTMMSTGSGEVMSVSSILVYDVYKIYIKPFRKNLKATDCVLCGKSKLFIKGKYPDCECVSSGDCQQCEKDIKQGLKGQLDDLDFPYKCVIHGRYRQYEDKLLEYKSWCMIWIIIGIIPVGMVVIESGMNLNWTFMAAQVFIAPFIVPLFLSIGWTKATGEGLVTGGITGLVFAVAGMLIAGSRYEGGLGKFYANTSQDYSILAGLGSGVVVSTVVSLLVSLKTYMSEGRRSGCQIYSNEAEVDYRENKNADIETENTQHDQDDEWQKTICIDNPLNPFTELYKNELQSVCAPGHIITTKHLSKIFRRARILSSICAIVSFCVFIVILPALALSQEVLTESQMHAWISISQYWCLIATVLVIVIPPLEEGRQILNQLRANKLRNPNECNTLQPHEIEDEKLHSTDSNQTSY